MQNQVLMALTEGGMQHLLAGARANVGISSGSCWAQEPFAEPYKPCKAVGPPEDISTK